MPTGQWLASSWISSSGAVYVPSDIRYNPSRYCIPDEHFGDKITIDIEEETIAIFSRYLYYYNRYKCKYCHNQLKIDLDIEWFYICKHCLSWLKFDTPKLAETNEVQSSSLEMKEKRID